MRLKKAIPKRQPRVSIPISINWKARPSEKIWIISSVTAIEKVNGKEIKTTFFIFSDIKRIVLEPQNDKAANSEKCAKVRTEPPTSAAEYFVLKINNESSMIQ